LNVITVSHQVLFYLIARYLAGLAARDKQPGTAQFEILADRWNEIDYPMPDEHVTRKKHVSGFSEVTLFHPSTRCPSILLVVFQVIGNGLPFSVIWL
jgi:hypothetical protein